VSPVSVRLTLPFLERREVLLTGDFRVPLGTPFRLVIDHLSFPVLTTEHGFDVLPETVEQRSLYGTSALEACPLIQLVIVRNFRRFTRTYYATRRAGTVTGELAR